MIRKIFLGSVVLYVSLLLGGCGSNILRTSSSGNRVVVADDLSKVRPRYKPGEPLATEEKTNQKPEADSADNSMADSVVAAPEETTEDDSSLVAPDPDEVTEKVNAVVDTLRNENSAIEFVSGYRIQVYQGKSRSEFEEAKEFAIDNLTSLEQYLSYDPPIYRLKVGDFMYRSDAAYLLNKTRKQHPDAVLIRERVKIKQALRFRNASR